MNATHTQSAINPLALEAELLLSRIEQGGHSGDYLANAFESCYCGTPFNQSLKTLRDMDYEVFQLFHEILHMRHTQGWSDEALYKLYQSIKAIRTQNRTDKANVEYF